MTPKEIIEDLRKDLCALCEETEEKCAAEAARDTEGKPGAFARGRIYEAKGIRRTMGEMFRIAKQKLDEEVVS
ncbi:hypothetical protein [Hyphomicrobium sp.]|uniref:hypothetical protein n=1 Tax=Hyphomicrobium sp. TaxID=82 RepID=UPI001E07CF9F|nr:hypothetical protein [Hyphomicrobium sp.]MBY0561527.1 hypothetical protein [Hyphomicrobium sp.]